MSKTSNAGCAIRHGASDAAEAATQVSEGIRTIVSKAVYGVFYSVSFGVVFSGLLLAKALPKGGAMEKGLHDGAHAAQTEFAKREEKTAEGEWLPAEGLVA